MTSGAGQREISDLRTLRALSHPRRYAVFQQLSVLGPSTSASLARAMQLNTGATSYHLRELAKYGFVEEYQPQEGAHGRERWWRVVPADLRFPPPSRQTPQIRELFDEMNRQAYLADVELFERLRRESSGLGVWADAFLSSRGTIQVSPDELSQFFEELIALVNRYKRDGGGDGETRTVLTRFFAFPAPEQGNESHPENG